MARRLTTRLAYLALVYLLGCPSPLRAQSTSSSARCSPSASAGQDENAEATGQNALPKVIVDDVVFDGSMSLPASIRDQLVAEIKQRDYAAGTEWLEELNEIAIRGAWQDQGFFKMTSTVKAQTISEDATEQHVSVTVHVDEGLQYRLSEIRFRKAPEDAPVVTNNDHSDTDETTINSRPSLRRKLTADDAKKLDAAELVFPPEQLRKSIALSDGDLFRTDAIREGLDSIKRLYGSHGYIEFVATPITEVDDGSGTILVIMELSEGRQYRVRKIEVQGLDARTEGNLKWRIQPGDLFNNELFEDFFVDNKDVLPAGASPRNAVLTKNRKNGTVDLRVVLQTCR
jgi:hypothetical protein